MMSQYNNISKYLICQDRKIIDAIKQLDTLSFEYSLTLYVTDSEQRVIGSMTDGDIRRAIINGVGLDESVEKAMSKNFTFLQKNKLDAEKLKQIKVKKIKTVPVLNDEQQLVKVVNFALNNSYLPLDAVLMAGGKGERLRPMTLTTPKPLLKVGNKPIIDYNVDNLLQCGVENISVTVNYLAEQLEAHFATPRPNGVQVKCVREPKYLGTIGSIKFVETWHNDTILVMNSDLFTNINLEDFYLHFKEHDADMSIAAVPYTVSIPYGIFEIEDIRDVKGVKEKPSYHYYANAGIYLIKHEVLDSIPQDTFFNATDLMDKLIAQSKKVIRFPMSGYWIDIGKPEDFKKVQDLAHHMQKQ